MISPDIPILVICMCVYAMFILPVLSFLVFYYGEKWRANWLKEQNQLSEPFDVKQTLGSEYHESQCPLWSWIIIVLSICTLLFVPFLSPALLGYTVAMIAFLLFVCYVFDGLRIEVNEQTVDVIWGGLHYRVLRIPYDSIVSVEVATFRPIRDFGGSGIKKGWSRDWRGTHAYYMSGTSGVLIQTDRGKKYLLGSDTPDRLVAVIRYRAEALS